MFIASIKVYVQDFYQRTIATNMVNNTTTGTQLLAAPVAERYECLTSNHECGGSNPAEDIIWEN